MASSMKSRVFIVFAIIIFSLLAVVSAAEPTKSTTKSTKAASTPKPDSTEPTITVLFPEKSAYIYWIEQKDSDGTIQISTPKHAGGSDVEIDLPSVTGTLSASELKIYDTKTGNVAVKSLQNLDGVTELKLKNRDFDVIRTVRLILKPENKPNERIESAVVTLTDANSTKTTVIIDPASEGTAEFHDVASGAANFEIAYEGRRKTEDIDLLKERDTPIDTEEIIISGKARTVKISAASTADDRGESKPDSKKKESAESPVNALQYIMSFALLVMIGLVVYVILKSKKMTLADSLKKMGVQLPQDADGSDLNMPAGQAPEPQVDPNVCQFCGQRKDPVTGNCSCSINGPLGGAPTSAAATGIPRLIGTQGQYAGHIFEMTGTESTLGRDPSNAIPLPEDTTASRRHARIGKVNGTFAITDEGSSNGTFVNGMRISGSHPLSPGDEVQVGSTKFRFEV
jgi:hypothetical protein